MPMIGTNLIGKRFGRITVFAKVKVRGSRTKWKYKCDCGAIKIAQTHHLTGGKIVSCGCYALEQRTTHGLTKSRAYRIWKEMRYRCSAKDRRNFKNYNGRGITVDTRWKQFENFFEDMGHPPDGLTLERIDNNGPYSKSNCKWATYKEQLSNRRNNHLLTAFGRTQTLTQWAEEYEINWHVLRHRVTKAGLSVEDALTAPKYYQQRRRKSEKPISDSE